MLQLITNPRTGLGLEEGSALARALYTVYAGEAVTVVDSPPGAGKTTLIVDLVTHLLASSNLKMVVATPTRRAAYDIGERLGAALIKLGHTHHKVHFGVRDMVLPPTLGEMAVHDRAPISIRTVASCTVSQPSCDVIIFDEAYQSTYSDVLSAANLSTQMLLVGDPGQIGPVITPETTSWDSMNIGPHHRAPDVLSREATVFNLPSSYRLGATSVEAVSPLYGFEFTSARPDRVLRLDGEPLGELEHLSVPASTDIADLDVMFTVAQRVLKLAEATVSTPTGTEETGHANVAVVVSHNAQVSALEAVLNSYGAGDIAVGTADSMQGGQWHGVVALDPLFGHEVVSPHQINAGRLCVMASRHMTHLTWVSDPCTTGRLQGAQEAYPDEVGKGIAVRNFLTAQETDND